MKKLLPVFVCCWLTLTGALPGVAARLAQVSEAAPAAFSLSGRIINHTGAPVPGAVVTVKGTANLTTTNSAGSFLLAVEQTTPVLVITCVGYQPQTLAVQTRNNLAVTLYPIGVAAPLNTAAPSTDAATATVVNPSLVVADVQPTYPGGLPAYREYMRLNAKYPETAKSYGQPASVYVGFMVDEAGRILEAQVLKGVGFGFDEEALRLVRLMPWWNPALVEGKAVKMACTLRINFTPEPPATNPNALAPVK